MKQLLFVLIVIVMTATGSGQGTCITCIDEGVDTAEIMRLYREISPRLIDSAVRELNRNVLIKKRVHDSLSVFIDSVYQQTFKKEAVLTVDQWKDAQGRTHTVFWKYFLFPNGDTVFYKTVPKIK